MRNLTSREQTLLFFIVLGVYFTIVTYLGFVSTFKHITFMFPLLLVWVSYLFFKGAINALKSWKLLDRKDKLTVAMIAFIAGLIVKTSFQYPDYSWDGQAYHLPMSVEWFVTQRISLVDLSLYSSTYPGLSELIQTIWFTSLNMFGPPHNVSQIMGYLLILYCIHVIADIYVLPLKLKIILLGFGATVPNLVLQSTTAYNDLFFNSLIVLSITCIYISIRGTRIEKFMSRMLLVFACGFVASTKFTGLYFLFATFLIYFIVSKRYQLESAKTVFSLIFLALAICAPWYLRNLVLYGNPMYPLSIDLFDRTIFQGSIGTPDSAFFDYFADRAGIQNTYLGVIQSWFWWPIQYPVYDTRIGGSGLLFLLTLSVTLLLLLKSTFRKFIQKLPFEIKATLVFAIISVFIVPAGWWPRYVLFFPLIVGTLSICLIYFTLKNLRVFLVILVLVTALESLFYFSFFAGEGIRKDDFQISKTIIGDSYRSLIGTIISDKRVNVYEKVAPELKSLADQGGLAVYVHKYGHKYFPLYGLRFQNSVDHAIDRVINPRYMPQGPGDRPSSIDEFGILTLNDGRPSVIVTEDKKFTNQILTTIEKCSAEMATKTFIVWCP